MKQLDNLKSFLASVKSPDKVIINEMITELETKAKKPENKGKDSELLIEFHDSINELVISEPLNKTFGLVKARVDDIIIGLRQ